tara:strand:+ start:9683 stop:9955 length:273 start_codon:yes stop_codon:yes gene_type:complete
LLSIFRVKGSSMEPSYKEGEIVICFRSQRLKPNDVIAIRTRNYGKALKRISSISNDEITVRSDNDAYSSRVNNIPYKFKSVIGKVILKIR